MKQRILPQKIQGHRPPLVPFLFVPQENLLHWIGYKDLKNNLLKLSTMLPMLTMLVMLTILTISAISTMLIMSLKDKAWRGWVSCPFHTDKFMYECSAVIELWERAKI